MTWYTTKVSSRPSRPTITRSVQHSVIRDLAFINPATSSAKNHSKPDKTQRHRHSECMSFFALYNLHSRRQRSFPFPTGYRPNFPLWFQISIVAMRKRSKYQKVNGFRLPKIQSKSLQISLWVASSYQGVREVHIPILCVVSSNRMQSEVLISGRGQDLLKTPCWQSMSSISKQPTQGQLDRSWRFSLGLGRDRVVIVKARTIRILENILEDMKRVSVYWVCCMCCG